MSLADILGPEDLFLIEHELLSLVERADLLQARLVDPRTGVDISFAKHPDGEPGLSEGGITEGQEASREVRLDDLSATLTVLSAADGDEERLAHALTSSELYIGALLRAVIRMVRAGRGRPSVMPPGRERLSGIPPLGV